MSNSKLELNIHQLEVEAKASAINHVINMLPRSGQLEKIEQYKRRLTRKKASVEALLKSAMQSQLDGVRVGLNQLHSSLQDIKEVEISLKSMNNLFTNIPDLYNKLYEVRDENMRHSQYVTARENLKHIFTVPESIKKTEQWINEGKLLHSHQCLRDLENSRDDLLFELHKLPNQSLSDVKLLCDYFAEVQELSKLLEKQLSLILSRTLNTVRKEPTIIVTTFRIIEREEKADEEATKHEKQTGFKSPGRPKRWKKNAFVILEKAVATRIEGTQVEEREDNVLWLVRYLELTRQLILEDLRVVKSLCVSCFPERYNIMNCYVQMYHNCLSRHLNEIIQNGLQGNEYVSVLSWILNTYKGTELMGHPDLTSYTENLPPLLSDTVLNGLQDQYLQNVEKNYNEWMQNTLTSEKQEWRSNKPPEDVTSSPVIIFQMIDQILQVTKTISDELTNKALVLSINQVIKYGHGYREAIIEFKNKHFENRNQAIYFTQYIITIINNCLQLTELGEQFQKHYWVTSSSQNLGEVFQQLKNTYMQLRNESGGYLLEEVFLDIEKNFEELFTSRWLSSTLPVDTICATLEDYFQDYGRLVEINFEFVITEALNLVTKRYIVSLLSKKISFKTYDECQTAAKKISKEIEQLIKIFASRSMNFYEKENPLDVILMLSEILKAEDDMLSFDLHRIVEKYPDVTEDHLNRLLYLRGDIPKADLKEKISFILNKGAILKNSYASIFKNIVFPDRIINW